jgi:hypothetical protein
VALEEDSNGLPTGSWNQFSLNRLLRDEANRPARPPFRRVTANHGDDALLLGCAQQRRGARTLLFVQRAVQSPLLVTVSDASDRLGSQLLQGARGLWCRGTVRQMHQGESAKDNAHGLDAASQEFIHRFTILSGDSYAKWATSHSPGYAETFCKATVL